MADNLKIAGLRLKIEGAAEFKQNITQINAQLEKSRATFEQVQTQYGKGAKSVELLAAKQQLLKDKLQASKDIGDQYQRVLEQTTAKYGENSAEADKVRAAIARNEAEQAKLKAQLEAVSRQLEIQSSKWTQFGQKCEAAGAKMKAVGDKLTSIGKTMTTTVTVPLAAAGTAASKAAIDFESAFAGVAKTVDATDEQLAELSDGIRDMAKEIPATTTEISAVAEAAGQLGIATEDVLDFTRVMIDLGNSTNLSAEEAASSLAKFANITGMAADDYDRLGSTIVALGNNFATTEADIVNMSTRLAGAGTTAGLTETDILALATAMSSVGIEAEAGGSAMSQTMNTIEKAVATGSDKVQEFARIAGMSADEFAQTWNDKPIDAITAFVKGLGQLDEQGESATLVLDELGLSGLRQSDMLKRLASASDLLTDAVGMSSRAWEENSALSEEAGKRYETMASRIQVAKNNLYDVGITIGNILMPYIEQAVTKIQSLADKFAGLSEKQQAAIVKFGGFAAAIGPVLMVFGKIATGVGSVVSVVGKLSTAIGAASAGGTALSGVLTALTGPIGIVVAAVTALAAGFVALFKSDEDFRASVTAGWESLKEFFSGLWDQLSEIFSAATELIKTIVSGMLESIQAFWEKHGEAISTFVSVTWEVIRTVIETVLTLISGIIKTITAIIQGDWEGAWNTVKSTAETIWNNIKSSIESIITQVKDTIHNKLEDIKQKWSSAWEAMKSKLEEAKSAISNKAQEIASSLQNALGNLYSKAYNWGANLVQGFIDGIRSMIASVRAAASETVANAELYTGFHSPAKKGPGRHIVEWGANMIKGFMTGMEQMQPKLTSLSENMMSAATGGMQAAAATADNRSYSFGGVTVQTMVVRNDNDIKLIARELHRLEVTTARGRGITL